MFFDSLEDVPRIAGSFNTTIFVVPSDAEIEIKNAIILRPEEKSTITIEQVRDVLSHLSVKQTSDVFVVIRPAELLGLEAMNAILKNLEEPNDKIHFVLVTDTLALLIPTILSRSAIYILKEKSSLDSAVNDDKKVIELARKLIVAKPQDLPVLAEQITKKKDGVRNSALDVLKTSIEILYKSYFKTKNPVFLKKIPRFVKAYDAISKNGHIKLHLVADLL